jgi:ABC-type bacteriocin/lantibiotic exporter with double-glycine peptidase domain
MRVFQTYIAEVIQRRIFVRVVADLSHRLPRARHESFDGAHGPELLNRFFEVMTVQKSAALLVLDGVSLCLQIAVGMAVLAVYHPLLLGFDVVLLAALAFVVLVLGRGAVQTSIDESRAKYAVAAWLEQLASCPVAFKSAGGPQRAAEHADRLAIDYLHARQQHFRVLLRQIWFTLGLQALAGSVLLGIGGWLVIRGQLTLGQLVAAELIVTLIVGSFAKLGKHLESFYDLLAAVDKLGHLFDLPVEAQQGEALESPGQPAALRVHDLPVGRHARPANFLVEPGEMVALVGPPGSGKSRLMEHFYSLRQPDHGTVELDGVDVRAIAPQSLREQVALVRGLELFPGTIAENVHLNRPDISLGEARRALQDIGLYEELKALPDGLATRIQPGGGPLTECQARRVVLARGLVGPPRLLLISELLDGLPDDVLADVLLALERLKTRTTIVIVTGRNDIAQACERVIPLAPTRPHSHSPDFLTPRQSA